MRKIIIILIINFFVMSCSVPEPPFFTTICKPKNIYIKSNFILKCIKNGNPKSDTEELEDLINACKHTADCLYNECEPAFYYKYGSREIYCTKAITKEEHEICGNKYDKK